jgi:hypothetical protein
LVSTDDNEKHLIIDNNFGISQTKAISLTVPKHYIGFSTVLTFAVKILAK